jgi:hypothetical protein
MIDWHSGAGMAARIRWRGTAYTPFPWRSGRSTLPARLLHAGLAWLLAGWKALRCVIWDSWRGPETGRVRPRSLSIDHADLSCCLYPTETHTTREAESLQSAKRLSFQISDPKTSL